jgi:subtilase family serine protease
MLRSRSRRALVCPLFAAITLIACSGDGSDRLTDAQETDAAVDAPIDVPDVDIDAPVDAPTPSALTLSPAGHDFDDVSLTQTSAPVMFTLENTGEGPTGAVSVSLVGAHAGDFAHTEACDELSPGAECTITVVFAPTVDGARVATLDVSAEHGGSASALLQGTGLPINPRLTILPSPAALGSIIVGQSSAATLLTVTNTGLAPSGALSITLANGDLGQFEIEPPANGDCTTATQLAATASCNVRVRFSPTSVGAKNVQLVVSASPGGNAVAALSGTGVPPEPASLTLSPTNASFETVPVGQPSAPSLFTVRNNGGSTSEAIAVISSSPRFVIGNDNCNNTTLNAMTACTFTVSYVPIIAGGANGQSSDTGTITVSASQAGVVTAGVSGTGSATLAVAVSAAGASGRVTSNPAGIDCATGTCTTTFTTGTVTLNAIAGASSGFGGWTGACAGIVGTACTVTMDAARTVGATFVPLRRLTVVASGGTVTSVPAGVSCPNDCIGDYNHGTMVTLTATPSAGYRFGSWSVPGCSGTTCTVTMDAALTVTATFVRQYTLTVNARDLGVSSASSVTVTPSVGSPVTCAAAPGSGATCSYAFDAGIDVVLSRSLGANTAFQGWTGDCAGTGGCGPLVMSQDRTVSASFAAYRVVVTIAGDGKVEIAPPTSGARCPDDSCTPVFPGGTMVILTPEPSAGSEFWGWGTGHCAGSGACGLTMDANKTALAEFRTARVLTLTKSGSGTVTSSPAGISCGSGCSSQQASYPDGRVVTLTASPSFGYELGAWGGACNGQIGASCSVTMSAARSASVSFVPGADLTVSAVTCTPDPIAPGATLSCSVTVHNDGTQPAGAFTNRLALSADAAIDGSDPQIGMCAVPSLGAGASTTVTCSGAVAAGTTVGAYFAGVTADSTAAIPESDENNNTGSDPVTVARPDITVSSVTCTPETAAVSSAVSCSVTFANAGPAVGAFNYDLRLSTDTTIDTTDDILVTSCSVAGGLAPDGTATTTCGANLPPALGAYRIGVIADRGGTVSESNESNNTASTAIRIGSDLVLSNVACTDVATTGDTATCTYTIANVGMASGPFTTTLRLSSDQAFDTSDVYVGSCHSTGMATDSSTNVTCSGAIPSGQATGLYYLAVMVDSPDTLPEWDFSAMPGNNIVGERITVTAASGIDLVASMGTCTPGFLPVGGALSCPVTVTNLGATAAGMFTVTLRYDDVAGVASFDSSIGSCTVASLAAGASTTLACNAIAPNDSGTLYIAAFADNPGAIAETNENNNRSEERTFHIATTSPDLDVVAMSCPPTATPGATVTCDVTIENHGQNPTTGFANKIVRSTDTTITVTDTPNADCNASSGIAGLGTTTLSCTLSLAGVTAGTTNIGVVLDIGANVAESDEANNTGSVSIVISPSGIDLHPDGPTVRCTPDAVAQGGTVLCTGTIANLGMTAAPASRTGVSYGTTPLGDCATPAIPALGTGTFTCFGTIPVGTLPGTGTIHVTSDWNSQIAEVSEANNVASQPLTVMLNSIDLVAQGLSCTSSSSAATCTVRVANTGGVVAGPFRISVRQSTDTLVDTSDPEVSSCSSPGLGPTSAATYACTFTLQGASPSVNMGVFVDVDNSIAESAEGNNLATATGVWVWPNLDITAMTCTYSSISDVASCAITVTNSTTVPAGPFDVVVRRSSDNVYATTDTFVMMGSATGLAPATAITLNISGMTSSSSGYAVAMVDEAMAVHESDENDNTGYYDW